MASTLRRRRIRRTIVTFLFLGSLCIASGGVARAHAAIATLQKSETAHVQTSSDSAATDGVQSITLDNGLSVLLKSLPPASASAPTINVRIAYGVGSIDEEESEAGVSHLLEHMLFKGTKARPARFGRLFHAVGDEFNAIVSREQTEYIHTFVGREKLNAILTLEADRMLNTQMTDRDLAIEKEVVIAEAIERNSNDPVSRLTESLFESAYPGNGHQHSSLESKADIRQISKEQIEAFYKKYYTPSNATLIVVGDFEPGETLQAIKTTFGSLVNTATAKSKPDEPPEAIAAIPMSAQTAPVVLQLPQAPHLVKALFALPNFTHPDSPAIELLIKHIAGSIRSSYEQSRRSGWYSIYAKVQPEQQAETVYQALRQSFTTIANQPIEAANLARLKEAYKASKKLTASSAEEQAGLISDLQTTAAGYRKTDDYLKAIEAVTPEDLLRVAQTYFNPDKAVVGFLAPEAASSQTLLPSSVGKVPVAENVGATAPVIPPDISKHLPPLIGNAATVDQRLPDIVVEDILNAAINHLNIDEIQTYPEKIRAVTLEETQAVLDALIEPDRLVIVTTPEPSLK